MSDAFPLALARVVRRHQRGVLLRAALTLALGTACAALLAQRMLLPPQMAALAAGTLWGACAAWQGWRLRRGWLSARATLATLDRQLGLQARLMTAAEFANAPEPPALYPTLVQEIEQSLEAAARRSPSVMSRTALMFAGLLLLIWLWPWPTPTSVRATHLARMASTPPPPPPQPDEQPQPQPQQQQGTQGAQGTEGTKGEQGRPGDQGTQGSEGQQAQAGKQETRENQERQGAQGNQGTGGRQEAQGRQGEQGTEGAQGREGAQAGQAQASAGHGGSQQMGAGTDALKADIQQALKELSEALKTLQAQLDARHVQAPAPGTSTDSELYGAASLEPPPGATSRLPLPLEMDAHATAAVRQGGSFGAPSRDIGTQTPQQEREETQLAAEAAPESATHQHAIPPEYQSVFERLKGPANDR